MVELSWDGGQKRPIVEWLDCRDVYVDPRTPGPVTDWCPATVVRKLINVQDLAEMRQTDGVKIPKDGILNFLAKARYITTGDVSKQREALAREEQWYPADYAIDPQHQQVECLQYWTKDRLIWILGLMWCAINKPNPYGFVPILRAPYTILEGRPYSMSLIEPLRGAQRYAQGIRNGRLDNLALALNRPRTKAAGTPTNPAKNAWAPGMVDEVSDVKQVEVHPIDNMTPDALQEEQLIHQDADRTTGQYGLTIIPSSPRGYDDPIRFCIESPKDGQFVGEPSLDIPKEETPKGKKPKFDVTPPDRVQPNLDCYSLVGV